MDRLQIGFFGMRNAGKSSLVNAFTNQSLSVVSPVKGTTTDPVKKAMELLPMGPVVIIDTPGIDDEGDLGALRIKKTKEILSKTDVAVLVADSTKELSKFDDELISAFKEKNIPYVIAFNKSDLLKEKKVSNENEIFVSATEKENIELLRNTVADISKNAGTKRYIVSDLIEKGDTALLVIPIDESAPKGRLILPQQQTIRDILDKGAMALCVKDSELKEALESLKNPPKLVITDSQVFGKVAKIVPESVPLTSFSILFARFKGELDSLIEGASTLDKLKDGDIVLVSEGCTHHRQCGDIGTIKIPNLIKKHTGKNISFEFTSGGEFPEDLDRFSLVVHCGGCMLTEREMKFRQETAEKQKVPMVNYGMAFAHMNGILDRSLSALGYSAK